MHLPPYRPLLYAGGLHQTHQAQVYPRFDGDIPGRRGLGSGGGGLEPGAGDVALNPVVKAATLVDVKPHIARVEVFKAEAKRNMKQNKRGVRGKRSERSDSEQNGRGSDVPENNIT